MLKTLKHVAVAKTPFVLIFAFVVGAIVYGYQLAKSSPLDAALVVAVVGSLATLCFDFVQRHSDRVRKRQVILSLIARELRSHIVGLEEQRQRRGTDLYELYRRGPLHWCSTIARHTSYLDSLVVAQVHLVNQSTRRANSIFRALRKLNKFTEEQCHRARTSGSDPQRIAAYLSRAERKVTLLESACAASLLDDLQTAVILYKSISPYVIDLDETDKRLDNPELTKFVKTLQTEVSAEGRLVGEDLKERFGFE